MNRIWNQKAVIGTKLPQSGATFEQVASQWIIAKKPLVKPSTYAVYSGILHNHLLPELGPLEISSASSWDLQSYFAVKLRSGRRDGRGALAPKTVADIRVVLGLILGYAQELGLCTAVGGYVIPIYPVQRTQVLTRTDQKLLEQFLLENTGPFETGVLLALYSGVRIGELCALQWKDLSLEEGTVRVEKTLLRIRNMEPGAFTKTRILLQRPKTPCSERTIPLPEDILRCCLPQKRQPEDYILTGNNRYMEPRACLKRYKKILTSADIGDYTFHALRHTFATRCVENGFDIKSLSEIMGHASVKITMQRYVHPTMEMKRQQMNRLTLLER